MAGSPGSAHSPDSADPVRESACGSDHRLREGVASLLLSDEQAGTFIEQPAATLLTDTRSRPFTPRLEPGAVVGRFEILAFLGAGGISQVYRARDSRLGRTVALKFVTDPADRAAGSRLLVEAQHASILNHPNICGVHEAENDDELPFIVLELVEGSTLSDVLKERRPAIREVIQWAKEIAAALDHAHRRGVIHRDLKSANVAVSPDGSVKVLDFGLSRRLAGTDGLVPSPTEILTHASVAGTLTHIAPEVLKGAPVDQRVDLWALGVMLYEMTSGSAPFRRTTAQQTADAILHEAPEPLPANVPNPLRHVIERCLAKEPASRFVSAADLRKALDALTLDDEQAPRNVAVGVAAIAAVVSAMLAVLVLYGGWQRLASPDAMPVVAVLPLDNATGESAEAFYADGVTEALIAELAHIDGIRVIAAATAMRSKTTTSSARQAARGAGADRFVEGSVGRTGDDVRLMARLIDADTGRVIWSQDYRREARQIQTLQSTVAEAIARAARVEVTAEDAKRLAAVRAVDPDVYEAYLKGRYHWNQRTPESLRTAIDYFESALKLDSRYAPAYAALADCYNQLATNMIAGGSPRIWRPKAADAAMKALQIDPNSAEAHATLAYVRHYDWQWEEAERSFRRAIAINPNNPLAHIWYANFLCSRLRLDEAVREVTIARDLDPLSLIVNTNVGWVLYYARQNDAAIEQFEKTLALDPTYQQARSRLATAYLRARRYDEGIALTAAIAQTTGARVGSLESVELAKLLAGRPNELERLLDATITQAGARYLSPGAIAEYYFAGWTIRGDRSPGTTGWNRSTGSCRVASFRSTTYQTHIRSCARSTT